MGLAWLALALLQPALGQSAESVAASRPLVEHKGWWIDARGDTPLPEVLTNAQWSNYSGSKSFGFGAEPVWVKVRIRGIDGLNTSAVVVRVSPPFTDRVTLFDPRNNLVLHSGRAVQPDPQAPSSVNLSFRIPALPEARDIYVKAVSISSRNLNIEAWPYEVAERTNRFQEWVLGAVLAVSLLFALMACMQWVVSREPVIGVFAVKQIVATLHSFFFLGFARQVIGPHLPDGSLVWMGSFLGTFLGATSAWFMATLIAQYKPWKPLLRALELAAVFYALAPLIWLAGWPQEMLIIVNASVPPIFFLLIATAVSAWPAKSEQPLPLSFLLGYIFLYGVLHTIAILIHLGFIPGTNSILVGNVSISILDGIIVFILLQFRLMAIGKKQRETERDLIITRSQTVAERGLRQEQERLFAMLAHELKTPLSTLRLGIATGSLKQDVMDQTISDLSKIIDRCVQTGQLADKTLQPEFESIDIAHFTGNVVKKCRDPSRVVYHHRAHENVMFTDPQMLTVVLSNLLDNACKYSPPSSSIAIELSNKKENGQKGYQWRFSNRVGPAGFPDTQKIFKKYYRSNHSRRFSGSGLGLYLVHEILSLLEGRIHYEPQQDAVVFAIWLPETGPADVGIG